MAKERKLADIFKHPDRCAGEAKSIKEVWAYFYRDMLVKRNISLADHNGFINRFVREKGIMGKAVSTFRSNLNSGFSKSTMTWSNYTAALKLYRCAKTTVTIEHEWGNGEFTYHYRVLIHRRKGMIIVDKMDAEINE